MNTFDILSFFGANTFVLEKHFECRTFLEYLYTVLLILKYLHHYLFLILHLLDYSI